MGWLLDVLGQIDLANPLILLRVYLTLLWTGLGVFVLWSARRHQHRESSKPLIVYTGVAALMGAGSYFTGVLNGSGIIDPPLTLTGFIGVGVLLAFTPIALALWILHARDVSKQEHVQEVRDNKRVKKVRDRS